MEDVELLSFENLGTSGFAIVARNHESHLVLAKLKISLEITNPTLAEALAVKEALSWAKKMEWNPVILESTCLVVIQLIHNAVPMRLSKVTEECRDLVYQFNNIKLHFIKRSANMSAH